VICNIPIYCFQAYTDEDNSESTLPARTGPRSQPHARLRKVHVLFDTGQSHIFVHTMLQQSSTLSGAMQSRNIHAYVLVSTSVSRFSRKGLGSLTMAFAYQSPCLDSVRDCGQSLHMSDILVSTPVVGFSPFAIEHRYVRWSFLSCASVQSVLSIFVRPPLGPLTTAPVI